MIARRAGAALGGLVAAGTVVLLAAAPAGAHVGVDRDEIEAGAPTTLSFSFSHGCGDSPTSSMRFQIPEGVDNAIPQVHPGWDVVIEKAPLAQPVQSAHGDEVTDRTAVITFTARSGFEVPTGQRDTVMLSFTAPEATGELYFPVIQGCTSGSNDWLTPWDGTGTEPEHPAPSVMVVATGASSGGGGMASTVASGDAASGTPASIAVGGEGASSDGDDGAGSSNALGIVGIVLGAAGLGAGGAALVKTSRKTDGRP